MGKKYTIWNVYILVPINHQEKINNLNRKQKHLNRYFTFRMAKNYEKHMKLYSVPLVIRKIGTKTAMKYHLTATGLVKIQKSVNTKS